MPPGDPPHRSQRAELPHWAPASGLTSSHYSNGGVRQLDVPASAHCARVPGTESGACFAVAGSPWPNPFPPHRPPRLAELCSGGSQVLRVRLTSHGRTSWDYGLSLAHATRWTIQRVAMRSPGSRARSFHACTGPRTPRARDGTCDSAPSDVAFRIPTRRRQPVDLDIGAQYLACVFPCQRFAPRLDCSCRLSSRTGTHDSGP